MRCAWVVVIAAALGFGVSCVSKPLQEQRFEFTQPQMGLPFRIVLYAADEQSAKMAADAANDRVAALNHILSDYEYDSELSTLSRTAGSGQAVKVSDELWHVLSRGQQLAQASGGAFDVTVGPAVSLWRHARREKRFPDAQRLATARKATGFRYLRLDEKNRTAELLVPHMRLDLGAIAKGYAIDEAMKVLKAHKVRSALVSGGGDMLASAPPPGKEAWTVELAPMETNRAPEFVHLTDAALATSGDLFQSVELDGKRYSHIVDPRTGIGLTDQSLVVVIARDCMTADSFSTTISVLGPEAGLKLAEKRGVAARIVRKPGEVMEKFETKSFRSHVASTTPPATR